MRFEENSYIHVYERGNRKQPIVYKPADWWRFVLMLRYFNDGYACSNFSRELEDLRKSNFRELIDWPAHWSKHQPLVSILNFTLMENHYHLILKELKEGNVTKFMRKLNTGMANYINTKYDQVGSLFQGNYKSRVAENDNDLMCLSVYVQVKNTFERYPNGGLSGALREFDKAYNWATQDPFTSLGDYAGERNSPIIEKDVLGEMFSSPEKYKAFAKQCMLRMNLDEKLGKLKLD